MAKPHLFVNEVRISKIREYLEKYPWYKKSFTRIQKMCDEMIEKGFSVPDQKGYVFNDACRAHNVSLVFDPYDKDNYICPVCKVNFKDEPYRKAWISFYHAWLSQMSVYLGISYIVTSDNKYANAIKEILEKYILYYPHYPNEDNEIGTTKIFQSTFMESIWLCYICAGYDMVNDSTVFSDEFRKKCLNLFKESAEVIKDYDESWNNRQAFNNSGMCAAAFLTNDDNLLNYSLYGKHGFAAHIGHSILEDGLWYEGDNYHFATVPAMVNIATMCMYNGIDMFNKSFNKRSLKDMFYGPLKSLHPDGTFPSRKDSPYANSIVNRWYCGLYELAYGVYKDKSLADFLNFTYDMKPDKSMPLSSAAGIMDIMKPAYGTREELDWRGFLSIEPETHSDKGLPVTDSINMTGTGLAVLRRKNSYLNLDYGHYGGGHGHPDRLNITCFLHGKRWFTDYGTGNYYLDHLRYYRSTLGHNTINQDGKRQSAVSGKCDLFYKGKLFDAASAIIDEIYPNTTARRTAILFDNDMAFDYVLIESDQNHVYHNVYHSFGKLNDDGYSDCEDIFEEEGYDFLHDVKTILVKDGYNNKFTDGSSSMSMYASADLEMVQYSAYAYGPPKSIPKLFPLLIQQKEGKKVIFANVYEHIDEKGIKSKKIVEFNTINDYKYLVTFSDSSVMEIDISEGVKISYDGNTESAVFKKENEEDSEISYECWIDYNSIDDKPLCIGLRNNNSYEKTALLFSEKVTLSPYEYKTFRNPLKGRGISIQDGYLKVVYNKDKEPFVKKIIDVFKYDRSKPINEADHKKNIFINHSSNFSRAERHWQGKDDLSVEGSIFTSSEQSLSIMLHVKDNEVLFSGGKYDYDNDCVQIYIDRRDQCYRNVDTLTDGIYSMILKGGVNGNVSKIIPMTKCLKDVSAISLSMNKTIQGYDVCIDIPFHCIGGRPSIGDIWGFDVVLSDRDSGVRRELIAYWSGALVGERTYMCGETDHDPRRYGLIRF